MGHVAEEGEAVKWRSLVRLLPKVRGVTLKRSPWSLGSGAEGWMYDDPVLSDVIKALYKSRAVYRFDWTAWAAEAPLAHDPALVARADLPDLRRLLTAHARQDRFSEGHL